MTTDNYYPDRDMDGSPYHHPPVTEADEIAYYAMLEARSTAWIFLAQARAHRLEGHDTAARRYLAAVAACRRRGY